MKLFRFLLVLCFMFLLSGFAEAGICQRIKERRAARLGGGCSSTQSTSFGGCASGGCRVGR